MIRIVLLLGCLIALTGCPSNNTTSPTNTPVTTTRANMRPDSVEGYLYYSVDGDSVVPASQRNSNAWDICMAYLQGDGRTRQIDVFLNSGPGRTGTTIGTVVASRFENVTTAGGLTLRSDDTTTSGRIVSIDLTGPGMFVYQPTQHTILPSPDKTLVMKTRSGKYAKFQFTSIYKDAPSAPTMFTPLGYYFFRYTTSTTTSF